MNASPIIDRLKTQCPALRFVGSAFDLDEATLKSIVAPAAFVIPSDETGAGISLDGQAMQPTQTWAIALFLKSVRGNRQQDQTQDLDALRQSVRAALQGWQVSPRHSPMQFESGQLSGIDAGLIVWVDTFTCFIAPA